MGTYGIVWRTACDEDRRECILGECVMGTDGSVRRTARDENRRKSLERKSVPGK